MGEAIEVTLGRRAVYRGHSYTAGGDGSNGKITLIRESTDEPIPDDLEPYLHDTPGRTFYAPLERVEQWYSSTWTFRWHDELFSVLGVRDGEITGHYTGGNGEFAERYLRRVGPIDYQGRFPISEVTDLTEHREDLLARWKDKQRNG